MLFLKYSDWVSTAGAGGEEKDASMGQPDEQESPKTPHNQEKSKKRKKQFNHTNAVNPTLPF